MDLVDGYRQMKYRKKEKKKEKWRKIEIIQILELLVHEMKLRKCVFRQTNYCETNVCNNIFTSVAKNHVIFGDECNDQFWKEIYENELKKFHLRKNNANFSLTKRREKVSFSKCIKIFKQTSNKSAEASVFPF